jgi:hypothetical protein
VIVAKWTSTRNTLARAASLDQPLSCSRCRLMLSHYEDLWRDGVTELVAHLDAEFPEEGGAGESRVAPPKVSGSGGASVLPWFSLSV